MTTVVKAYLQLGTNEEIRRFQIENLGFFPNYEAFKEKIFHAFPLLKDKKFVMKWKDEDNDYITFSCQEEFNDAFVAANSGTLKIYITLVNDQPTDKYNLFRAPFAVETSSAVVHEGVICDNCNMSPIKGNRYKCQTCSNYDLCTECEKKKVHEHDMVIFDKPMQYTGPFGFHLRGGDNFSHPFWMKKKWKRNIKEFLKSQWTDPFVSSSSDEDGPFPGASSEELATVKSIIKMVSEKAREIAASASNDKAGSAAENATKVGVRAALRRAFILRNESGFSFKQKKKRSRSSSSSDSDSDEREKVGKPLKSFSNIRRRARVGGKRGFRFAYDNTSPYFGHNVARWIAQVTKQSIMVAIIQTCSKNKSSDPPAADVPMETDDTVTKERSFIDEALHKMSEMGFDNENDGLRKLLEAKNGNISAVLEHIGKNFNL